MVLIKGMKLFDLILKSNEVSKNLIVLEENQKLKEDERKSFVSRLFLFMFEKIINELFSFIGQQIWMLYYSGITSPF